MSRKRQKTRLARGIELYAPLFTMPGPGISSETLADLEIPSDVKISPSGKQVIYSVKPFSRKDKDEISSIWIAQTDEKHSARRLTSGSWNDRQPLWSPDGTSFAFLSDRGARGKSCAIYILHLTDSDVSDEPIPITAAQNAKSISKFAWSPSGLFIAYTSADERPDSEACDWKVYDENLEYHRLRLVNVSSRTVQTLYDYDAHVYQIGWSPDSKDIAFAHLPSPDLNAEDDSKTTIEIISVSDRARITITSLTTVRSPLHWTDDGSYIYFVSSAFLKSAIIQSQSVWEIEFKSKNLRRFDFGDCNCASTLGKNVGGLIYMLNREDLHDRLTTLDYRFHYNAKHRISSADVFQISETQYLFVTIEGSASLPENIRACVHNSFSSASHDQGPEVIWLSKHNLDVRIDAECKALRYQSKYGKIKSLDGWFFGPRATTVGTRITSEPLPTVVLVHGGPYNQAHNGFDNTLHGWQPKILSTARYGVLLPNYRGGSGRGQEFAECARGAMGTVDYDDVITCIEYAIAERLVDKNRIIICGWSQGGFISYLAAVRNGELARWKFKGAICGAGVTDWDTLTMTSDRPNLERELSGHAPWDGAVPFDELNQEYAQRSSPIRQIADHKDDIPPLLMLHGQDDERVPVTQALGFRSGLRAHGVKYQLVTYPREPHIFRERAHIIDMMDRVIKFIDLHIGS